MAVYQLKISWLTHCYREQVESSHRPSHIWNYVCSKYQAISATTAANAFAGSAAWLIGRPITR